MKTVNAIITGGKDEFGIWLEDISGVSGAGETVEEAKKSLLEAISLYGEEEELPEALKGEYEINYSFDTSGFLKYYSKFISFAGMNEITGIHRKQLWNYANGYRNPSKATAKKIFESIQAFASGINQVNYRF